MSRVGDLIMDVFIVRSADVGSNAEREAEVFLEFFYLI